MMSSGCSEIIGPRREDTPDLLAGAPRRGPTWPHRAAGKVRPVGQSVSDPYAALDAAPGIYGSSRDLTLAIEEEFQILDGQTLALTNRFEELKARCDAQPWGEHVAGELIASEIEIKTGRCETFDEAAVLTAERRRALFAEADALGLELCATGCHPWSPW